MHVLVVYAHPSRRSFNGALLDAVIEEVNSLGHTIEVSDLYAEGFNACGGPQDFIKLQEPAQFHYQSEQKSAALSDNFVPEIAREQARLRRADLLILQFPLWWGGVPAILKGWFDRVATYGVAYADGMRFESGLFKGRRSLVSVTTGGTPARFSEAGDYGPIEKVLWPVQQLFLGYLGFARVPPQVAWAVARVEDEARCEAVSALRLRVRELLEAPYQRRELPTPQALLAAVGNRDWRHKG
ncbi:NAD(P)H-dependent oxidoreductase [Pluralibacter gergoviae]|nr:NAD(P)H-dependent oxidoreductase [Pluralibacter gergoviae]ELW9443355.1 NAD(P)H-dependent oxidoreductase [Pluralibacter gergoviae]